MTVYGYARVSTKGQDLALQRDALKDYGVDHRRIYADVGTGTNMKRPKFESMDSKLKEGDTVVVWKLDRLGRSMDELIEYVIDLGKRGVDVKLILPGIPDKKIAYSLAKQHYKRLTEAGVKIYEYTPGFVHAKIFVSDDAKAVVGTINLDYRSLYHHFECAAYLYKSACISAIEADFQTTLAKCRAVTPESIKHEKLYYKVMGKIMQFFAPMM